MSFSLFYFKPVPQILPLLSIFSLAVNYHLLLTKRYKQQKTLLVSFRKKWKLDEWCLLLQNGLEVESLGWKSQKAGQ